MGNSLVKISEGYDYTRMIADLAELKDRYPKIEILPIGRSVLGRLIPAVKFGSGPRHLHYSGAFHADEWLTSLLLMVFLERCLNAEQSNEKLVGFAVPELLRKNSLWLVPMVNPDGIEIVQNGLLADNNPYYRLVLQANSCSTNFRGWRANARGVDLTLQFPASWENVLQGRKASEPAPLNYPGPAPLSEPEARALADLTRSVPFDLVMVLYTQGQDIDWVYSSNAGFTDWFIDEFQKPGFTVKCGSGQLPLPLSRFEDTWSAAAKMMLTALLLC